MIKTLIKKLLFRLCTKQRWQLLFWNALTASYSQEGIKDKNQAFYHILGIEFNANPNEFTKKFCALVEKPLAANTLPFDFYNQMSVALNANFYFGQEGEDAVLQRWFGNKIKAGTFVDVGAHHPMRFSNTFNLYLKGWRGINIDATPGSMEPFKSYRPEDCNVETAVSNITTEQNFHVFVEPALNTFNHRLAEEYITQNCKRKEIIKLQSRRLADILDEHLITPEEFKLLTIDVEAHEMSVLESNNWDKYAPELIIIEQLDTHFYDIQATPIVKYLALLNYEPVSKLVQSLILRKKA